MAQSEIACPVSGVPIRAESFMRLVSDSVGAERFGIGLVERVSAVEAVDASETAAMSILQRVHRSMYGGRRPICGCEPSFPNVGLVGEMSRAGRQQTTEGRRGPKPHRDVDGMPRTTSQPVASATRVRRRETQDRGDLVQEKAALDANPLPLRRFDSNRVRTPRPKTRTSHLPSDPEKRLCAWIEVTRTVRWKAQCLFPVLWMRV
jgi:hypothetical protein